MTMPKTKGTSYSQGHIACFYSDMAERMKLLANYLKEGIAQHELCILATTGDESEILTSLQHAGFNARAAKIAGSLRILKMKSTYLPTGTFDADRTLANLEMFINESRQHGYEGLRIAGEMRWITLYPDFLPDAMRYEDRVNGLETEHPEFIGLCLYPLVADSIEVLCDALLTHPAYMYDGILRINPYTSAAERHKVRQIQDLSAFKELLTNTYL